MPFVKGLCGAILLVPLGLVFVRVGIQLRRDPSLLRPGHWLYNSVLGRVGRRNHPWRQAEGLRQRHKIWAARWALVGGVVSILYGLYFLIEGVVGAFKQSMLWEYLQR